MSASEIAALEPKASRSFVNGMSNFLATNFTFSLLMSDGAVTDFYWLDYSAPLIFGFCLSIVDYY